MQAHCGHICHDQSQANIKKSRWLQIHHSHKRFWETEFEDQATHFVLDNFQKNFVQNWNQGKYLTCINAIDGRLDQWSSWSINVRSCSSDGWSPPKSEIEPLDGLGQASPIPCTGGRQQDRLTMVALYENPCCRLQHTTIHKKIPFVRLHSVFDNVVVRTHYTPSGLGKARIWGSPPSNENQTMFKGTIKIFPQHFIYLAEGGQKYHHQFVDIWYTKILNNLSSDKNSFVNPLVWKGDK